MSPASLPSLPTVPAVLADTDRPLHIDRFLAASEGAPQNVPHAEEDKPEDPPPPADEDPPQNSVLRSLIHFVDYIYINMIASTSWTNHSYSS